MIGVADGDAVERDVRDEIKETLAQSVKVAPMLHMLGVDIGHDRDCSRQAVEGAVAFVGLDHHPVGLTHAGV